MITVAMDAPAMWRAVRARDRRHDGRFLFGVSTTGVFCRPSCPSRQPRREHVRFFDSAHAALQAGFRPCRRCRPLDPAGTDAASARVRTACALIRAAAPDVPSLEALATRVGVTTFHLQRTFKALVGLTPKQYADACRLDALKRALRMRASVTEAIYEAGFSSSSRAHDASARLGMTPGDYRRGGAGLAISCASAATPFGRLMVAATDRGVCFVQFGASHAALRRMLREEFPAARVTGMAPADAPQFKAWMSHVLARLQEPRAAAAIPLDVRATAFQARVWHYLQSIPPGEVRSYAEVARALGRPTAARAVARACATNPVAIVVPCHRVLRGDGGLGGYRWGLTVKRRLLAHEAQAARHTRRA
jgi:AraC family transcriptional regulator of adaptative response/methylated-DNA-[protein]-cysteine methyltransferase